ncbi:bifunctional folylpolyglutamate synthase/dihydrofolate synthase [Tuberibacillus sp. Marseille-P3662]|uniref:bifunctional folylpolyglutamate synthase/dihydrofolate synthase n=1 Tax=Tuberibacillus sp. Marseille-P3662 TaxID=1965358 RepID=UPI000A1CF2AF|nr:folylpolyglutamate synthase/dihydrofolate synthase family protein [Tuberibacillus sp. Marseille-P3662]
MFMTRDDVLEALHQLKPHGIKPGTERMTWILNQLGNPERRIKAIHIGGTNGKGSVVNFLSSMYREAGYDVGAFISPYITTFNERISINGVNITDQDLVAAANEVFPYVQNLISTTDLGEPTEFEVITLISLVYFSRIRRCDLVLYEVGLGGRLDSTNVIHPIATVITNVGQDHMAYLGNTLESIAREKAGIIKSGVAVITTADDPALNIITETAKEYHAPLYALNQRFSVTPEDENEPEVDFTFSYGRKVMDHLSINMIGTHQLKNAAAALMVVDYLETFYAILCDREHVYAGLRKASWPGRMEIVSRQPLTILDGAHNPEGMQALVTTLQTKYPDYNVRVLYTSLSDKPNDDMIKSLSGQVQTMILTTFDFPRASQPEQLKNLSVCPDSRVQADWESALNQLINEADEQDLILICGSLYFVAEVRKRFVKTANF